MEGRFKDALSSDSATVKKAALGAGLGQVSSRPCITFARVESIIRPTNKIMILRLW